MSGSRSFDTFLIAHFGCPKVAQRLSTSCPKAVHKLPEVCWKVAPRHKHGNGHESGPRKSCGALDRCILHRMLVRTTLLQRHVLVWRSNFGLRDINMEMVTKVVLVRAVELSIGAFCTEFRCEQLCDNGIFWIGPGSRPSGSGNGHKKLDLGTRVSVAQKKKSHGSRVLFLIQ